MTPESDRLRSLLPPPARYCEGMGVFILNAELDPKKSDEENLRDVRNVAIRKCIRCKHLNPELPCTINETHEERAKREMAQLSARFARLEHERSGNDTTSQSE